MSQARLAVERKLLVFLGHQWLFLPISDKFLAQISKAINRNLQV
jgi:hypothetical protein